MFVRFRPVGRRLMISLVETRRLGRKVRSETITNLGSIALGEPIPLRERIGFWQQLGGRFHDLAARRPNRVSAEQRRNAIDAIYRRIPKPDPALMRALEQSDRQRRELIEAFIADSARREPSRAAP